MKFMALLYKNIYNKPMDRKFIILSAGAIVVLFIAIIAVAVLSVRRTNESITTSVIETPSRIGRSLTGTRRGMTSPVKKPKMGRMPNAELLLLRLDGQLHSHYLSGSILSAYMESALKIQPPTASI